MNSDGAYARSRARAGTSPEPPLRNRPHTGATWPTTAASPVHSATDCQAVSTWVDANAMRDASGTR